MSLLLTNFGFKNILAKFFLVFIMLLFPAGNFAQSTGKIAGKVTEATSGTSLPGANVIIVGTTIGVAADLQGNYTLSNIQSGSYKLKVSFLGYQEQVLDVAVQTNKTVAIDFALQETVTELDVAVVYGELTRGQAKSLNEQKNAPNIKNVVSSEQFQLSPDRNAAETTARIPGVSISYDQGEGEVIT